MAINITSICQSELSEQILFNAHSSTAFPSLFINLFVTYLILLVVGLLGFDSPEGKFKFFIVWIIGLFLGIIVTTFLALSPIFVQSIWSFISNIWI